MGFYETDEDQRAAFPSAKELRGQIPRILCLPALPRVTEPTCSVTARQLHTTARKFLNQSPRACFTSVISCPQSTLRAPGDESTGALQTPFIFAMRSFHHISISREGRTGEGTACSGQGLLCKFLSLPRAAGTKEVIQGATTAFLWLRHPAGNALCSSKAPGTLTQGSTAFSSPLYSSLPIASGWREQLSLLHSPRSRAREKPLTHCTVPYSAPVPYSTQTPLAP